MDNTPEEKEKYNKTKYNNSYNKAKYDSLRIVIPKGKKSKLQNYCKSQGISLNKLINNYIESLPLGDWLICCNVYFVVKVQ